MTTNSSSGRPQVHGHRGCRGLRPENTLPAFLHALALGVDALELDVVVSADQQVVVTHEPWLPAQLGLGPAGEPIDPARERTYNLHQMPYALIRQCALGLWPPPQFPEQVPVPAYRPLLREVLAAGEETCLRLRRPPVAYSIEIKYDPAGAGVYYPEPAALAALVLAELERARVADRTTILSFDTQVLRAVRQAAPGQRLCLLVEARPISSSMLFAALGFVPDALGPDYRLLSVELVQQLRQRWPMLQLVPWTVNEPAVLEKLLAWKVDGITTDYPDWLIYLLNEEKAG